MPIERDLSHLPKAQERGHPPDAVSRFGAILVDLWHDEAADNPRAVSTARFRYSDAGKCSRALAYAALNVPQDNLPSAPDSFIMRQGSELHGAWQDAVIAYYKGMFAVEVEAVTSIGDDMSGHMDLLISGAKKISVEAKTVDGYAYKMAIGERGAPQGPKADHILQACLNAKAADADEAVVLYLSRGAVSRGAAQRAGIPDMQRVTAEWTYTREEYEPLAEQEIARVTAILALIDEGTLPARKIPTAELPLGHLIIHPESGQWAVFNSEGLIENTGTYWMCTYCRWQNTCAQTGARREPVEVLYQIGALHRE